MHLAYWNWIEEKPIQMCPSHYERAVPTLSIWAAQYREKGLKMLEDQPRPGRSIKISGEQRAKITALACSKPPEGYARWHLRLLADKAVELGYCEAISHTEVASILKKTN